MKSVLKGGYYGYPDHIRGRPPGCLQNAADNEGRWRDHVDCSLLRVEGYMVLRQARHRTRWGAVLGNGTKGVSASIERK